MRIFTFRSTVLAGLSLLAGWGTFRSDDSLVNIALSVEERLTIIAADDPGIADNCYDYNRSNCTAVDSTGKLTTCGSAYSGPCNGSSAGACSYTNISTYTIKPGQTISNPTLTDNDGGFTCGFVKTGGACTAIPNDSGNVQGAGCYSRGGTPGTTPCGVAKDLPPDQQICNQP